MSATFQDPLIERAVEFANLAIEADRNAQYSKAVRLYSHAAELYRHVIQKDEVRSERTKESIREKCARYSQRAEELQKEYLVRNTQFYCPR
ncbi:vacuolar protein sorting-associated protein 4-like [Brevipalpus obovatus]|uniref:vacuolar protein sorting-associated protein 4-like n=1 Tax=Brevipalpus obovatus TaxID=246614 RepID=UPI003D9E09B3